MSVSRIYLGTWMPRTHMHLVETYEFLKEGRVDGASPVESGHLQKALSISNLRFEEHADFDIVSFESNDVRISIAEDGVILLLKEHVTDLQQDTKDIEKFYTERLGPAIAHLFNRGAPLPQTLMNLSEIYPKIFVGQSLSDDEIKEVFTVNNDVAFSQMNDGKTTVHYGKETEVVNFAKMPQSEKLDYFAANAVFTQTYNDLLRRYLSAHRTVWEEINALKRTRTLRYSDFPKIQNEILDHTKTISFVQTRLEQMSDILTSNHAAISEEDRRVLVGLGFGSFTTLAASTQYLSNLWKMTAEHANSTLKTFEVLVTENTQRELRLLQQFAVAGALVGFFGMNIAFPWDETWARNAESSLMIVLFIVAFLAVCYCLLIFLIHRRKIVFTEITGTEA